ncbi:NADP-dependent 3-hydroxy acid dehydrogenase YdfG [Amycolatopsis xylanica]|uniref:NADP-dependent 3-hydroxy acid dehydrogenase YdfG n=1 Tax=Amycolatopsis xylanica TaxID=589385 RepID=A0A1H3EZ82_9PSEU|nr:SDR family NAD(P)-dependent oxidoreductase [Amycolatopsis xylanica]SDX83867.1 NADP-dependent 3-hydroxy acid dehydrogenase YdfG [Amycolatopsis xylanica]
MQNLAGKTIVVTGASAGIGAAAARQLHAAGANVVPVGRSADKTAAIAKELGVEGLTVDYTNLADVRRLAGELLERCPRIDVLANNAGGLWTQRNITVDGYEQTFQVNCLAPYLLTRLLTDRLRESGGRVVITTSDNHKTGKVNLDDLDSEQGYKSQKAYANSKLAAAILNREYARRYPELGVADFHPGVVASEFSRDMKLMHAFANSPLGKPMRHFLTSPEQGAETLVYLSGTTEPLHGGYYVKSKPAKPAKLASDENLATELWEITSRRVGLVA